MVYKISVNNQKTIEAQTKAGAILVNNQEIPLDLIKINERSFHIISQHQSYNVEVLQADLPHKKFIFKINGKVVETALQDQLDQLIARMGMHTAEETHEKEIKAPMPGLILNIAIKEGQTVNKGDALLTLEAMKMENVLKSPAQGVVVSLRVKEQQSVDKNQILAIIE